MQLYAVDGFGKINIDYGLYGGVHLFYIVAGRPPVLIRVDGPAGKAGFLTCPTIGAGSAHQGILPTPGGVILHAPSNTTVPPHIEHHHSPSSSPPSQD